MTDQHPLTDDIIRYDKKLGCQDFGTWIYTENDLRAVADWQLQRVLRWLNEAIYERSLHEAEDLPEELAQAMRPTNTTTTQENN